MGFDGDVGRDLFSRLDALVEDEDGVEDGDDGADDELPEVDAPSPPAMVAPVAAPVAPAGPRLYHFPLFSSEDGPCLLPHPLKVADGTDTPVVCVHQAVNEATALNAPPRYKRGPYLGDLTHDATEQDVAKVFGPGRYYVCIKNPRGDFLKWTSVAIGREAQQPHAGAFVVHQAQAQAQPDAPPAWARELLAKVERLEAERAKPAAFDLGGITQALDQLEQVQGQLVTVQSRFGELAQRMNPAAAAAPVVAEEDDEEEDGGLIGGTQRVLGQALEGGMALRETLQGFQELFGRK